MLASKTGKNGKVRIELEIPRKLARALRAVAKKEPGGMNGVFKKFLARGV